MKKLILPLVAFLCLSMNVLAQSTGACDVYSFTIEYISAEPSANDDSKRDIRLNLTWDIDMNSGSSATYFHIWQENAYVLIDYSKTSKPPTAADLSRTLGTIAIQNPATAPTIVNYYAPDANYKKLIGVGNKIERKEMDNGTVRYTISNLAIQGVSARADGSYSFTGDIWSSQSGNNIHCVAKGRTFVVNEVANRSMLSCEGSGKIRVGLASTQPGSTGTFQVLVENTNTSSTNQATYVAITTAQSYKTSETGTLASDFPYNFFGPEITIPKEYNGLPVILLVTPTGKSNQLFKESSACAPLPVTFGVFSAARKGNSVAVKWQTTYELNVSGFNVQRMTTGTWNTVAFVPAKNLANGSNYELTDINTHKGLSQYRIVSVDIDGKQKLSEVRSVRGEESSTKLTVYPNPSTTGRLNLVFDNNSVRDISVLDMSGRIVKQLQGQRSNNVSLEIMQDGLYQVQIIDRTTGELTVEKVIVKKR
ncbi:MAG TPA: T9SS type A sorting domain-containing protein [Flavisolibacter sp.]|jgi:hypothetical protein|nr:T9SS type A sorting domain-containing protein [Flavisolibacter sp.]